VTFNSGTYVLLGGGLSAKGSGSLSGTSVTFYNTYNSTYPYAGIDMSGSGSMNFSAPTSGSLAGILVFQDRSVPTGSAASKFNGSGSSTFTGAVYMPTTAVNYIGSGSGSPYTILVAYDVSLTGSGSLTIGNNYSSLADGSPIKSHALFE
jgi:hypothetical protein